MDPKCCFTIFLFLFLSCSLQGLSQDLSALAGNFQGNLEGIMKEAQLLASGAGAGSECIKKLMPCEPYLMSTFPPKECCNPLGEVVADDKECLCKAIVDTQVLKSLNVTTKELAAVPFACGYEFDRDVCKTLGFHVAKSETRTKAPSPSANQQPKANAPTTSPPTSTTESTPMASSDDTSGASAPNSRAPDATKEEDKAKSSAAVTVAPSFFSKFVAVCVLMNAAAFHF